MALTAVIAICFASYRALFPIPVIPAVISILLFALAVNPYPLFWQCLEMAAMAAWFAATIIEISDVQVGFSSFLWLLMIGPAICLSWMLRTCLRWQRPKSRADWAALLHLPVAVVLLAVLLWTGLPLNLRLTMSESALRACISELGPKTAQYADLEEPRVGLFWARSIQVREGCVLWTTGSFLTGAHGLAYIPRKEPPTWDGHHFAHIRGPWWSFEN